MRVAFSLPDIESKQDRFRMVCALSNRVDRLVLLTDALSESLGAKAQRFPNLEIILFPRKTYRRSAARWLNSRIQAHEFDIIHDTFGHLAAVIQAWAPIRNRPYRLFSTLYTNNWGWFSRVRNPSMDFWFSYAAQRILTLWSDRRICRVADRIFVLGPGLELDVIQAHHTDPERITCVPSEVNTETFDLGPAPLDEVPTLLFTGAVCRNKGIDVLLESLSLMREQSFRLKLIGRILFWERAWFKDALAASGLADRIERMDQIAHDEIPAHYHGARIFVFPSRFEGSPRSVREALASGVPSVVSDIPGHRVLDPEQRFLHVVPTFDPATWAQSLTTALNESDQEYATRARAGRDHMVKCHSFEAVAEKIERAYTETLAIPPSGGC